MSNINLTVAAPFNVWTTVPLDFGGPITFTNPQTKTTSIVDEIFLTYDIQDVELEFFRRFNQWFASVRVYGAGYPLNSMWLTLTHVDRVARIVYHIPAKFTILRAA